MSLFYSQELTKPRTENHCAKCETHFVNWEIYHIHVTTVNCAKKIKPFNVSGRSKTQIVSDWESRQMKGTII